MFDRLKKLKLLFKKHLDKVAHFGVFFIFSYYAFMLLIQVLNTLQTVLSVFVIMTIISFIGEKLDDKSDVYDLVINEIAIIVALLSFILFN